MIRAFIFLTALIGLPSLGFAHPVGTRQPVSDVAAIAKARQTMQNYGACIARHSAKKAGELLTRDFHSSDYKAGLAALSRINERDCFKRGEMHSNSLLFAGAIAEALIKADSQPVNVRLARAATAPAAKSYSVSDAAAMCIVRSVPDDIGVLFSTKVGSPQEQEELAKLRALLPRCNPEPQKQLAINDAGLRAMLATASFRALAATNSKLSD